MSNWWEVHEVNEVQRLRKRGCKKIKIKKQ